MAQTPFFAIGTTEEFAFTPQGMNGQTAQWGDVLASSGKLIGQRKLFITMRPPTQGNRSTTLLVKLVVPYLKTLSGDSGGYVADDAVHYQNLAELKFVFSDKSSKVSRQNLRAIAKNLLADAGFLTDAVENYAMSFDATSEVEET